VRKARSNIAKLEEHIAKEHAKLDEIERCLENVVNEIPMAVARENRRKDAQINRLERELKTAKREAAKAPTASTADAIHPADLSRAKTVAIFDAILFAIENWSSDGQTASDFTIVCQSLLFPLVYEKVMSGEDDYYIEYVPPSAAEVVKRGREFIHYLRRQSDTTLVSDEAWSSSCAMIHEWLINDGLPLLYGARDEGWQDEVPYSLAQMQQWRDMPQSRLLDFPRIQDAMDLVKIHGDTIRDTTGLPAFTTATLNTRIQL